jgi:GT2 family glycosyltransferase
MSLGIQAITLDGGGQGRGAHSITESYDDGERGWLGPQWVLLPGALAALVSAAEQPGVGAVGPLASVDPQGLVLLPCNVEPSPGELLRTFLVHTSPVYARAGARVRLARNRAWWGSGAALDAELLSGACLLLPRAVCRRLGELFDPGFPLYFEDTDLCRRLRQLGLRLRHEPRARIVHHWARSTGVAFSDETQRRYAVGLERYSRKWYGGLGASASTSLTRVLRRLAPRPIHAFEDLGRLARPFALHIPQPEPWVIELALAPSFLLTAGVLGDGARWSLPQRAWEWLFAGRYWLRATHRASGALLGAWTFEKTTPARAEPLREDEVLAAEALA